MAAADVHWAEVHERERERRFHLRDPGSGETLLLSGRDCADIMELNGTQKFAAPPQTVWNALHNDTILKNSIPAAESITWQGDNAVTVSGGIGPIKGTLTAQVVEQAAPTHMKFSVNRTQVSGALAVDLAADGAGTVLTYAGTVTGTGAVGAGLTMVQGLIKGQVEQFFSRLESQIK